MVLMATDVLRETSLEARSAAADEAFLDMVEDAGADLVLLGEASHGTFEFYEHRAHLTRLLVTRCGFSALVVEADWPDAERVDRFIRGRGGDDNAIACLAGFTRFPQWMWRNWQVVGLVDWLQRHNQRLPAAERVSFHGLDLYSLHRSMQSVIAYLERTDPEAAQRARQRYACFDPYDDPHRYGQAATWGLDSCDREALAQLAEMRRLAEAARAGNGGLEAADDAFAAEQDAQLVIDAERYYRSMFSTRLSSWNLRDQHMDAVVEALRAHLARTRGPQAAKLVVWAHNSHLGDARATDFALRGELNLGQLLRQRHGARMLSIGFTTHTGTVAAAAEWGGPVERKRIRPSLPGSYEALFHTLGQEALFIPMRGRGEVTNLLAASRLERAIGVVYRPHTERESHWFHARMSAQFDAVYHFDETRAVEPLETIGAWPADELPETYPSSL